MSNELPYVFTIDVDPINYKGAASAETTTYQWKKEVNGEVVEESPLFYKAVDAKTWIETELWDGTAEEEGWVRVTGKEMKTLQEAFDATDEVIKDYLKTAEKFCREGKDLVVKGFMTASNVTKNKDIKGIEDRYQGNRTGEKPVYLQQVRKYVLENYKWVKMTKDGFEADSPVVGLAEKHKGCCMSIDKDLDQIEEAWHINMNEEFSRRECKYATALGDLWLEKTFRGKDKTKGDGFKFLCYQAVVGDVSDGYKGLMGVGDKAALKALQPCETKVECIKAVEELYKKKAKKGYVCKKILAHNADVVENGGLYIDAEPNVFKYISWDGELQHRTIHEMMQQHFNLAYQERSPTDSFNLEDYIDG